VAIEKIKISTYRPFPLRWRPLEGALAALGSQAEAVLDGIEDEQESGRPKPIDIDSLLVNVIPPILSASGRSKVESSW